MSKDSRYRIVSDYGYGDKTWLERNLTEQQVKEYFINNCGCTSEDFDKNGIDFYLNLETIIYVEIDKPTDKEDWNHEDS